MSLNLEEMKLSGFEPDPDMKWEKIGERAEPVGVFLPSLVPIDSHRVLVTDLYRGPSRNNHENFGRVFDTRAREWSNEEWPNLHQPRDHFGIVLCNGKVYVIGGVNSDGDYLDSIECLDLSVLPLQWISLDQRLAAARCCCDCVAIGTQVFILGEIGEGNTKLTSVEILDAETNQLVPGPDVPQHEHLAAVAVNNELFAFTKYTFGEPIHALRLGQSNSMWQRMSSTSLDLSFNAPVVICNSVVFQPFIVYDTKRECWWKLPETVNNVPAHFRWTLVGDTEIIAFSNTSIYSLKFKFSVQPPKDTIVRHTKTILGSMLFSRDYSDVTFVCHDGSEIPAHRVVLASKNPYFQAYFSGPWTAQHPDGRWETEISSDVMKAVLSLIYTGEVQANLSDAHLLELLDTVYKFQLDGDLLRVCQAICMENITVANVKNLLLSAKLHDASFLFDTCFKYVCENFAQLGSDPGFAADIIKVDAQLWRDIFEYHGSRKRQRSDGQS